MPAPKPSKLLGAGVSVLAGVAVALAFPPYGVVVALPVGLAGLMWAVAGQRGRVGLWLGLLFGLGYMAVLLFWNTIVGYDGWVAVTVLEASFYGLLGMSWAWLSAYRWWPLAYAVTWVGTEFLRSNVPFGGLPWGRLAFGLVETPFVAWGRVGGTALVAFLAVLATALVVDVVRRRDRTPVGLAAVGVAALVVLASPFLPTGPSGPEETVTVAAVQGDVPGEGMDPFSERRAVLHNHASATQSLAESVQQGRLPQPDAVIWPENSTDIDPYRDPVAYDEIAAAVRAIGVPTLIGAVVDGPDALHVQNMGIVWSPESGPGAQYVKRHPVPFGEYIPFREQLTRVIERFEQIPRDFYAGEKVGVLDVGGVTVGDLICFEVAYDGLVRDVVDAGARVVVVQTNNATWAGSRPGQLEQQWAISRYRAVETGRTVVVAATNGISGFVQPDGTVLARSDIGTRDVLVEDVTLAGGTTLGVRLGGWVDVLLSILALVATGYAYLGKRGRVGRMVT